MDFNRGTLPDFFTQSDHRSRDGSTPVCDCNTTTAGSGIASIHAIIGSP
jgi:hypothetical protein